MDYADITKAFKPFGKARHFYLNEIAGLKTHERKRRRVDLEKAEPKFCCSPKWSCGDVYSRGVFIGEESNCLSVQPS